MSATMMHEQCPKCHGQRIAVYTTTGLGLACGHCGGTGRVDSPAALARLADLEAEVARLRGERAAIARLNYSRIEVREGDWAWHIRVAPPDGRVNFDTEAEAVAAVRQAAGLDAPAAGGGEGER